MTKGQILLVPLGADPDPFREGALKMRGAHAHLIRDFTQPDRGLRIIKDFDRPAYDAVMVGLCHIGHGDVVACEINTGDPILAVCAAPARRGGEGALPPRAPPRYLAIKEAIVFFGL